LPVLKLSFIAVKDNYLILEVFFPQSAHTHGHQGLLKLLHRVTAQHHSQVFRSCWRRQDQIWDPSGTNGLCWPATLLVLR